VLRLSPRSWHSDAFVALAAAGGAALLVVAAAEPQVARDARRQVRTDAQLYVVLDTSQSMSARAGSRGATRLERAKAFALRFRDALPEIPAGVASFTDRVLPHLLPSADESTFAQTLSDAVGVDRPPPQSSEAVATTYANLVQLPGGGSFAPTARKRLLVLLTDGESTPFAAGDVARALRRDRTALLVARFWAADERVYVDGRDSGYRPAPASGARFATLGAVAVGGRVFGPGSALAAAAAARRFFGAGPTVTVDARRSAEPVGQWLALAALLPLGLVAARRGGGASPRRATRRTLAHP